MSITLLPTFDDMPDDGTIFETFAQADLCLQVGVTPEAADEYLKRANFQAAALGKVPVAFKGETDEGLVVYAVNHVFLELLRTAR